MHQKINTQEERAEKEEHKETCKLNLHEFLFREDNLIQNLMQYPKFQC